MRNSCLFFRNSKNRIYSENENPYYDRLFEVQVNLLSENFYLHARQMLYVLLLTMYVELLSDLNVKRPV